MSLLPDDASYLEQIQAYFLAFRGDGVALSPLDAELLADWKARGVPYPVVCRGIRKAAETLLYNGGPGARLRTLRSCRAAVEREFRRFCGAPATPGAAPACPTPAPGAGPITLPASPGNFALERMKKARAALRKALKADPAEPLRAGLEAAAALVAMELDDPRQVATLISRADDALALVFLRRLPFAARRPLLRAARQAAGPRPEGASARARQDALRAHLVALARAHGQLPSLA